MPSRKLGRLPAQGLVTEAFMAYACVAFLPGAFDLGCFLALTMCGGWGGHTTTTGPRRTASAGRDCTGDSVSASSTWTMAARAG